MLSGHELTNLCWRLGLSDKAKAIVESIRSSPPTRRVRGAAGNVIVRYPSRKMGVTIQAESHRNELAGIYEKEHDPDTLEFYDQPPAIKLTYRAKNGQQVGILHTPDYFVIRTDSLGWEEWKTEEELRQLMEKMPNRYVRGDDGRWYCSPGERYAEQFGFFYRVRSSAEIDWIFQRNLLFLEDYLRAERVAVDEQEAEAILTLVTNMPGICLNALLRRIEGWSSDSIYAMIASDQIYVDLHATPLAEPERVRIFRDEETARAYSAMGEACCHSTAGAARSVALAVGASITWDGRRWTIVNPGLTTTALLAEDGTIVELANGTIEVLIGQGKVVGAAELVQAGFSDEARERLLRASPDDFREANRRYAAIASHLSGGKTPGTTPTRTVRQWLMTWRQAERTHNCGYVGLLPQTSLRGNRNRKLTEAVLLLLDEFIAKDYETLKQKGKLEVYAALVRACEEQAITTPSYKTFARAVRGRPQREQIEKRQGKRSSYQSSAFFWELTLTTPRHGDRPFEIGHIDHTQLDVELICSRTGRNLGRPWATFLIDAFSRRLLAIYLTFDPPSYRSCMMVLRECVRRHQRLPQIVVVDGGGEFGSVYFETLLARYECTKKTWPAAQPRFGSVCERLFGTTNTRFVHNLVGNTQILRNVRQVTRAVDPKEHARWTLDRLYVCLCEWAYEVYDTIEHPALGTSPREAFVAGLGQGGQRPYRLIPYDDDFRMLTLPTTRKGTAMLQPRLGVKINHIFYWSEAFVNPEVERTQMPVRYDPFDAGLAYTFVKGHWVRCISEHHARFVGRSEREIRLASAELRRQNQRHAQQFTVTARKLADFLASLEAEEVLLDQRLRDSAAKDVFAIIVGGRGGDSGQPPLFTASTTGDESKSQAPGQRADADQSSAEGALIMYEDY